MALKQNIDGETVWFPPPIDAGVEREVESRAPEVDADDRLLVARPSWGRLPELAYVLSVGLLLIAYAFFVSRSGRPGAGLLFWPALGLMVAAVVYRLASEDATRRERLGLVVLLGMALYLVKVMYNPLALTFPDELSHLRNATEVLQSQRLFHENPALPVTALYPGLAIVTSSLANFSGLPLVTAAFIVIALARLIICLALFLLYEQVSGSARVAGLGAAFYMANSNFLYWTAQYAYESLALPLAVVALLLVARRERALDGGGRSWAWALLAALVIVSVAVTHHMTSYALTVLLWALSLVTLWRSRRRALGPLDLALLSLTSVVLWLVFVAQMTVDYLSPVVRNAVASILRLIVQEEESRQLFSSPSTGYVAPVWEQWAALTAVFLIALGVPFGLYHIWRARREQPFVLVLGALAIPFFPIQLLRLTSAGWETSNRASEFLFLGIAFVLALAVTVYWLPHWGGRTGRLALAACAVVLVFGGFIAGWPSKARLPRPYLVSAGQHQVVPQSLAVSRWMLSTLGPDNRLAADTTNAKLANGVGNQYALTGSKYGVYDMMAVGPVGTAERNIIRKTKLGYVLIDRRQVSWDGLVGPYFAYPQRSPAWELERIDPSGAEQFDRAQGVNRVLDSGDIVLYDVGVYRETPLE